MFLTSLKILLVGCLTLLFSFFAIGTVLVDRNGSLYHSIARTWAHQVLWIFGVKVHLSGTENLESGKAYVYVSNHASMFDIPVVIASIPDQIRIVYKKELSYVPVWGWALAVGPYVSIDRFSAKDAMKSLDAAAEKIRGGASVLLFAEGTRTRTGKLQSFKRGAFALAAKAAIPIVPVTINNSFNILPKGSLRIRRADISLIVDKPIPTVGIDGRGDEMTLMESVYRKISQHYIDQG